jgi:hypothetical protein
MRLDVFGWFENPGDETPAHDPGVKGVCPGCGKQLFPPLMTVSLMHAIGGHRSYFYRLHKACDENLSEKEKGAIDCSLMDEFWLEMFGNNAP